ncbi:MAG: hypothetical protein SXA11_11750 [Cyanobacteriota bacterium]|nr:hypothetical protein [Cyanobacteriota bacterium]
MTNYIQPFLDNPQELINQSIEIQLAVANNPATPRELLELLAASDNPEVATAAQNHVNWAGELTEDCHEAAEKLLRNSNLGQNDRLAVELLKFAPVPEWFLSKWVPASRLCLANNYLPRRWQVQFLERLAREDSLEPRLRVAESPHTPVSILEELAGDWEMPLRVAVQYNPNCPPDTVAFAESQQAIASNWDTDPQQLAELAESRWSWVRLAVAQNPSSPPSVLEKLAGGDFDLIQEAVARNPSSPTAALEKLMEVDEDSMRQALAKHPRASEGMLLSLVPRYSGAIAKRTELPVSVMEKLIDESDRQYSLLQQQNMTSALLERLLEGASEYRRAEIVRHPLASGSMLERLAEDGDAKVRLAVAQNLNTPEELRIRLLEELAGGADGNIRVAIARDPETPINILERLAGTFSIAVLSYEVNLAIALAENPATPANLLESLWGTSDAQTDTSTAIAVAVCSNPKADGSLLETIERTYYREIQVSRKTPNAGTYYSKVRFAIANNPAVPEAERVAYLRECVVTNIYSAEIAKNPNTPTIILEELVERRSEKTKGTRQKKAQTKNTRQVTRTSRTSSRSASPTRRALGGIELAIADNPNAPVSALREAARSTDKRTLEKLAKNPNTPPELLEEIALNGDRNLRDTALNALEPLRAYRIELEWEERKRQQQAEQLMARRTRRFSSSTKAPSSDNWLARIKAASNIKARVSLLEQLAKDPDEGVRKEVAKNSSLPLNLRLELTGDRSDRIRMELAKKQSGQQTPVEVLERLASDRSQSVRALVAQNPDAPSSVLEKLANDTAREVKLKVVSNPNTPVEILERLGLEEGIFDKRNPKTPGSVLARAVTQIRDDKKLVDFLRRPVKGSQMPAETLEQLLSDNYWVVRNEVARHPNTPPRILRRLANDIHCAIAVSQNPNTPAEVLEPLLGRIKPDNRSYQNICNNLASRPDAPPSLLDLLASNAHASVRRTVAGRTMTPITALERFVNQESDENVLKRLASNPSLTPELLARLAENPIPDIRSHLIYNTNLTPELWQQLAADGEKSVRGALANFARSPVASLETLACDEDTEIRHKVAANPNTPKNVLETLSRDAAIIVRATVAAKTNTPENVLERLAEDEKIEVRRAVAENPATPTPIRESLRDLLPLASRKLSPTLRGLGLIYNKETDDLPSRLSQYARSPVALVRFVALRHPLTPADALRQGSESLCWWERYAVADNPATPAEIRQRLAGDSDRIVRAVCSDR